MQQIKKFNITELSAYTWIIVNPFFEPSNAKIFKKLLDI